MKATVETVNSVQKRVKIEIDAANVSEAFDKAYGDIKKKASIKGFRKGKAPISVIKKVYGESVASDVVDKLINGNLFSALADNKINPIASPVIEEAGLPKAGEGYSFTALVDILPDFELKNYKGLKLTVHKYEVKDADIEKEIEMLQRNAGSTKPVEEGTTAAKSHMVTISHTGKLEGVEKDELKASDVKVEIGAGHLIPEMEDALVGMKKGDTKEVEIKLPEHVPTKEFANKTASFSITMGDIEELVLPEVNDEFAKDNNFESLNELKSNIEKRLQDQAEQSRRAELESNLLKTLREENPIEVPPAMVDNAIDGMIDEMHRDAKQANAMKKDQAVRDQYKAQAKERVQNSLYLLEIIKKEEIKVEDADVKAHVEKMIGGATEENAALIDSLIKQSGSQLKESLVFTKAMDLCIDSAKLDEHNHG